MHFLLPTNTFRNTIPPLIRRVPYLKRTAIMWPSCKRSDMPVESCGRPVLPTDRRTSHLGLRRSIPRRPGYRHRLYWDHVPPQAQALAPENALVLATGPLAGVPVIGGSRLFVCGKSPATSPEHLSYCNMGSDWAIRLKSAGYDLVFIQGKADRPVYLLIHDGTAELKDASALWGQGAIRARETLAAELGGEISVVAIGPGGENQATMACLIASDDAAGGAGMGAVMSSKNLKAIVVQGPRKRTKPARPEKLEELTKHFRQIITPSPMATAGGWPCVSPCRRAARRPASAAWATAAMGLPVEGRTEGQVHVPVGHLLPAMAEMVYARTTRCRSAPNKLCDEYGLDTWPSP